MYLIIREVEQLLAPPSIEDRLKDLAQLIIERAIKTFEEYRDGFVDLPDDPSPKELRKATESLREVIDVALGVYQDIHEGETQFQAKVDRLRENEPPETWSHELEATGLTETEVLGRFFDDCHEVLDEILDALV